MKKKIAIIAIIVILIGSFFVLLLFMGNKPFKNLKATDIVSAQIELGPPDSTVQIIDIEELIPYLNNLVVYGKDQSYTESCGQTVIVTLKTIDGKQTEIGAMYPFIIINGVGYKAKYEPCYTLERYANSMLH